MNQKARRLFCTRRTFVCQTTINPLLSALATA